MVFGTAFAFLLVPQFDVTHCSEGMQKEPWLMGTETGQSVCQLPAKRFLNSHFSTWNKKQINLLINDCNFFFFFLMALLKDFQDD